MPAPANLVHQTSATTGTGNLTLAAVNGKQSFSTAFGTGGTDVFDYFVSNESAAEWERGTGHMSDSTTLVRDTVIESTNSNAAVNFSAGTKDVVNDVPAAKQVTTDTTQTLTNKTISGGILTGTSDVQQALLISGDISPTQITANQNDYSPTGLSTAAVLRLSSDATRNITGLAGGADGRVIVIHNVGSNAIVLIDESASSTAGNRFALVGDLTINGDHSVALQYDSTSSRWRTIGAVSASAVGTAMNSATAITDLADTDRFGVLDASASNALVPVTWGTIKSEIITEAIVGKETVWIPATAMISRTTNGAAPGTVEMTTNKNMFKTLDFDTTTQEFAQFEIHMPKSWNLSTVTFQPVWSHAATTTNFGVVWQLAAVARSDGDAGDVAFGTAQTSTDTGGTTNVIYIGPESSAITVGGTPAAGDTVQFQVARVPANASDTMAIDARLHGIRLFYTTNAANDT